MAAAVFFDGGGNLIIENYTADAVAKKLQEAEELGKIADFPLALQPVFINPNKVMFVVTASKVDRASVDKAAQTAGMLAK